MAEFSFDYLSCVELINEFHPKFYRSHPDWLQVTATDTVTVTVTVNGVALNTATASLN